MMLPFVIQTDRVNNSAVESQSKGHFDNTYYSTLVDMKQIRVLLSTKILL
jgi:hypothetical protein